MSDDRATSTQHAYNSIGAEFAARTITRSEMAAQFFDRFCRTLEPASKVADLGCGPGHDVNRLLQAGHFPIAVDRSTGLLRQCAAPAVTMAGDLRAVPIASAGVDAIWSSAALLHVRQEDLAAAFQEWNRVLRPGGVVGFATSLSASRAVEEGWELVPASPGRVAELPSGERRWFIHHDQAELLRLVDGVGWSLRWSAVRHSRRDWLQAIAVKPAEE